MECDYEGCQRSYCSSFNLKRHIESCHFGLRKFKCQVCNRFLSSKQNLIDHQNIHSGAKPYVCEIPSCNMNFRQLSQYYLHKQLHVEVSSHIATGCSKSFIDQGLKFLAKEISTESINSYYYTDTLNSPINEVQLPKLSSKQLDVELPIPSILEQYRRKAD